MLIWEGRYISFLEMALSLKVGEVKMTQQNQGARLMFEAKAPAFILSVLPDKQNVNLKGFKLS